MPTGLALVRNGLTSVLAVVVAVLLLGATPAGAVTTKGRTKTLAKIAYPRGGDITFAQVHFRAPSKKAAKKRPKIVLPAGKARPKTATIYVAVQRDTTRKGKRKHAFVATVAILNRTKKAAKTKRSASAAALHLATIRVIGRYAVLPGTKQLKGVLAAGSRFPLYGSGCLFGKAYFFVGGSAILNYKPSKAMQAACHIATHTPAPGTGGIVGAIGGTIPPGFFPPTTPPITPPVTPPVTPPTAPLAQSFNLAVDQAVTPDHPSAGEGRIEKAGSSDAYHFTLPAPRTVFLDEQAVDGGCVSTSPLHWTLTGPGGTAPVDHVPLALCGGDRGPLELAAGAYTLTVAAPAGNATTGAYAFTLRDATPQTFSVVIGDTVSAGKPKAGAGEIGTPGQADVYRFDAVAGQGLTVDAISAPGGCAGASPIRWTLRRPNGAGELFSDEDLGTCADRGPLTLPDDGTYELDVHMPAGSDKVGAYGFKLVASGAVQSFPIAVGADISPDSPVAGEGKLEFAGSRDVYTFSRQRAGQKVFLDLQAACATSPDLRWTLEKPQGGTVFTDVGLRDCGGDRGPATLDQDGDYTLTVFTPTDSPATGGYHFKLWDVPDEAAVPITVGAATATGGAVETPGRTHSYSFSATAGQKVLVDLRGTNGSCTGAATSLTLSVESAAGDAVLAPTSMATCDDPEPVTIPATGTYKVVVRAPQDDDETGTYRFLLRDLSKADASALAFGQAIDGDLQTAGNEDFYSFEVTSPRRVFFDVRRIENENCVNTPGSQHFRWQLENPDGTVAFDRALKFCSETADRGDLSLTQLGTYHLRVYADDGATTGAYRVFVSDVVTPDPSTPLVFGQVVDGAIPDPGDGHDYTFTLAQSKRLFFDARQLGTNCVNDRDANHLRWSLTGPGGASVFERGMAGCDTASDVGPRTLGPGTYTLHIGAPVDDDAFGTYEFFVTDVPTPDPTSGLPFDSPVSGEIKDPGDARLYTFHLDAPTSLEFDVKALSTFCTNPGAAGNLRWSLTGPGATQQFDKQMKNCNADSNFGPKTLPAGDYTVRVGAPADDDAVGTYTIEALHAP